MENQQTIGWFDLETTGKNTSKDRIVQISIVKTDLQLNEIERSKLLINPGITIPSGASKVHGLYDKDVENKPKFDNYAPRFLTYFDSFTYIGGYNIKTYDVPLLHEEFSRCKIDWNPKPIIDPSIIFKNRERRTLEAALMFYCGKKMEGAHDAQNDVLATIEVLRGQTFKYGFDEIFASDSILDIIPVEKVWLEESKYEDEGRRLDYAGKIILNDDGVAIFNFGKYKDQNKPVTSDIPYCGWILGANDFTANTKNIVRALVESVK